MHALDGLFELLARIAVCAFANGPTNAQQNVTRDWAHSNKGTPSLGTGYHAALAKHEGGWWCRNISCCSLWQDELHLTNRCCHSFVDKWRAEERRHGFGSESATRNIGTLLKLDLRCDLQRRRYEHLLLILVRCTDINAV